MKSRKIFALFTCVVLCFVIGMSSAFIIKESDHVCTGHGCQICVHIHQCEALLQNLGQVLLGIAAFLLLILNKFVVVISTFVIVFVIKLTLVTLKVKLSN